MRNLGSHAARSGLVAALVAVVALSALPLWGGNGNGIPPGQNPFQYLLVLIADLQAQIDELAGASACPELSADDLAGTWSVANAGTGTTGQVTFTAGGAYTIDSGTYNAGGTFLGAASGTYSVLSGGAIAFTYAGWAGSQPVSRIAIVRCAGENEIVHYVAGHTHDYEILTRVP